MDSSYSISRGFPADTTRATNTARRCRMSGAIEYTVPSSCARVAASSNVFCESASRSTCCDARERRNPSLIATARGDHGFAGSARRSANELFSTSIPSPWAATRTTTERRPASSSSKWAAIGAPRFAAFPIASARVSLLRVSARISGRSCLPYSSPGAEARSAVSSNDTTTIDAPPNRIVATTYSELSQAATLPRRRRTSRRNFSRSPYDDERARGLSVGVVVILARRARAEQTAVLADELRDPHRSRVRGPLRPHHRGSRRVRRARVRRRDRRQRARGTAIGGAGGAPRRCRPRGSRCDWEHPDRYARRGPRSAEAAREARARGRAQHHQP